jgi:hypothetical protein
MPRVRARLEEQTAARESEVGKMAKGQKRSNKEVRKPKAKAPKKTNASEVSRKPVGIANS